MKRFAIVLVIGLLFLLGCHSAGVTGKWKVDPDFAKAHENIQPQGFMTGFVSTFTYEFKDDHTFKGSMSEGTYTLDGSHLSMTTTKLMGQDISKLGGKTTKPQMTGELSSDGQSITLHLPPSGMIPAALQSGVKMAKDAG